ncbi:hypothetical protein P2G88_11930 [Aliiglaciecola sp. CAU 1673]|uniref:hypothetical protein n=1 Tax=Aliiglaciecola sp. CAU 1673 TaxID=3032595 RepID=UPI0023DC6702|nr:hypothetical protein [Aliiglaciecola sp. CAU 1673]MDF2178959.1 hypothetical protein [Aliiglaciecola sp. CAU 1673]
MNKKGKLKGRMLRHNSTRRRLLLKRVMRKVHQRRQQYQVTELFQEHPQQG